MVSQSTRGGMRWGKGGFAYDYMIYDENYELHQAWIEIQSFMGQKKKKLRQSAVTWFFR